MDKKNHSYVALLRGINVGGNNIIKMVDLKNCFENLKFTDVVTYIQSGNVIFKTADSDQEKLTTKIEAALSEKFNYKSRVVIISQSQLAAAIKNTPHGFGAHPTEYRYDVIFLKKPLTASDALQSISVKEGIDKVFAGKDVVYFSRLIEKATQSKLSKIVSSPIYQNITIRNWNTTIKLLALIEKN